MARGLIFLPLLALFACAGADDGGATRDVTDATFEVDAGPLDAAEPAGEPDAGLRDAAAPPDAGEPTDAAGPDASSPPPVDAAPPPPPPMDQGPPPVPALDCEYRADDFDAALREYDVMGQPADRLVFRIPDLPDPAVVEAATLVFSAYDLDHPGEEGTIVVNGAGPFPIPADAGLDNMESDAQVDVTGATVAGQNRVEFGPSATQPRTFFRIGRVALRLRARVAACREAPPPPPPEAVVRQVGYRAARYTRRNNWVVRCNDYAFTARGGEHIPDDCDGRYDPDNSRRGTAVFAFPGLVPATYEVVIRSRHTANRNPRGALFIVDGEERRISQQSDRDRTDDVWGQKRMGGDVEVILDSSREDESDSIISVTLRPVAP